MLREVRILLDRGDALCRVCKLAFGDDASLYILPTAGLATYHYGQVAHAKGQRDVQIHWPGLPYASKRVPKISIHESGHVHVKGEAGKSGPLIGTPLSEYRGEHVATITADHFAALPRYPSAVRTEGEVVDLILDPQPGMASLAVMLYINAEDAVFGDDCQITGGLMRPNLDAPLRFGLRTVSRPPLIAAASDVGGITAIAGWLRGASHGPFFAVRGQSPLSAVSPGAL